MDHSSETLPLTLLPMPPMLPSSIDTEATLANGIAANIAALADQDFVKRQEIITQLGFILPSNIVVNYDWEKTSLTIQWIDHRSYFQTVLQDPATSTVPHSLPYQDYVDGNMGNDERITGFTSEDYNCNGFNDVDWEMWVDGLTEI